MKNWGAQEWSLFILAATIPFSIIILTVGRLISRVPVTEGAITMMKDIMLVILGGIFTKLSGEYKNKTIEP